MFHVPTFDDSSCLRLHVPFQCIRQWDTWEWCHAAWPPHLGHSCPCEDNQTDSCDAGTDPWRGQTHHSRVSGICCLKILVNYIMKNVKNVEIYSKLLYLTVSWAKAIVIAIAQCAIAIHSNKAANDSHMLRVRAYHKMVYINLTFSRKCGYPHHSVRLWIVYHLMFDWLPVAVQLNGSTQVHVGWFVLASDDRVVDRIVNARLTHVWIWITSLLLHHYYTTFIERLR